MMPRSDGASACRSDSVSTPEFQPSMTRCRGWPPGQLRHRHGKASPADAAIADVSPLLAGTVVPAAHAEHSRLDIHGIRSPVAPGVVIRQTGGGLSCVTVRPGMPPNRRSQESRRRFPSGPSSRGCGRGRRRGCLRACTGRWCPCRCSTGSAELCSAACAAMRDRAAGCRTSMRRFSLAAGPPGARGSAGQKTSGGAARPPSWTPCGKDDGS